MTTEKIDIPIVEISSPPSRAALQIGAGVDFKLNVRAEDGDAFKRLFASARGGAAAVCIGHDVTTSVCYTWPIIELVNPPRFVFDSEGEQRAVAMLLHPNTGELIFRSSSPTRMYYARNATTFSRSYESKRIQDICREH